MKCPKCKEDNPNDALFCQRCGQKLKDGVVDKLKVRLKEKDSELAEVNEQLQKLRTLKKGLLIVLIGCVITIGVLEYFQFSDRKDYCEAQTEIYNLNDEICKLKSQLPQVYYTKFDKQYFYYICKPKDGYQKSSCYIDNKGLPLVVYVVGTTESGEGLYGLTQFGWIPMDCLEKK